MHLSNPLSSCPALRPRGICVLIVCVHSSIQLLSRQQSRVCGPRVITIGRVFDVSELHTVRV